VLELDALDVDDALLELLALLVLLDELDEVLDEVDEPDELDDALLVLDELAEPVDELLELPVPVVLEELRSCRRPRWSRRPSTTSRRAMWQVVQPLVRPAAITPPAPPRAAAGIPALRQLAGVSGGLRRCGGVFDFFTTSSSQSGSVSAPPRYAARSAG
jgi:hypothetical protein